MRIWAVHFCCFFRDAPAAKATKSVIDALNGILIIDQVSANRSAEVNVSVQAFDKTEAIIHSLCDSKWWNLMIKNECWASELFGSHC